MKYMKERHKIHKPHEFKVSEKEKQLKQRELILKKRYSRYRSERKIKECKYQNKLWLGYELTEEAKDPDFLCSNAPYLSNK